MKKNKQNKKQRFQTIEFNFDDLLYNPECDDNKDIIIAEEAKIYISNNDIYIEDVETGERDNISAYTSLFYEKDNKKEKIINKMLWNGENDINLNVLKNYDGIFAVDTSPCMVFDKKISVASIVQLYKENENTYIGIITNKMWENIEVKDEEREVYAYAKVLDYIAFNNIEQKKNIIFVDCNLDKLEDYNNKKKPLIRDFYVPYNCELAYSSSDVERDYIGNMLLREVDKSAKKCAKLIMKEGIDRAKLTEKSFFTVRIEK